MGSLKIKKQRRPKIELIEIAIFEYRNNFQFQSSIVAVVSYLAITIMLLVMVYLALFMLAIFRRKS